MYYWYLREQTATVTATGVQVVAVTNVACHLWLRWSTEKTGKHMDAVVRRGMVTREVPRFCVVSYNDVEQEEEGNTITHTFLVTPWPACQTRWYYLWGTMYGEATPSVSPLFKYHRVAPEFAIACTSDEHPVWYYNFSGGYGISAPFKPGEAYSISKVKFRLAKYFAREPLTHGHLGIWNTAADDEPVGSPLRYVRFDINVGETDVFYWHEVIFAPLPLEAGTIYALGWIYPDIGDGLDRRINVRRGENFTCLTPGNWYWLYTIATSSWAKIGHADTFYETYKSG
ncbi:hypothetical protein ES705_35469 [subsurface metagenome]